MQGDHQSGSLRGRSYIKLCKIFKPSKIIETGTHNGCSTNYLLKYAEEEEATVYSFDVESTAGKSIISNLRSNLVLTKPAKRLWHQKAISTRVEELRSSVLNIAQRGVDLFFHDSDHRYENAKWELDNITKYMDKGSPVILHDIAFITEDHQTQKLFNEVNCSWKYIFDTPCGIGLIVL